MQKYVKNALAVLEVFHFLILNASKLRVILQNKILLCTLFHLHTYS